MSGRCCDRQNAVTAVERFDEAEWVFERMLWLDPPDEQYVHRLIDEVRRRTVWEDYEFA